MLKLAHRMMRRSPLFDIVGSTPKLVREVTAPHVGNDREVRTPTSTQKQ
jgi:hypothetical protein